MDGDAASNFAIVGQPAHGSLGGLSGAVCAGGVPNVCTRTVSYKPASNYNGTDAFSYRVNDGKLSSASAAVTINVAPVNDAPTLSSFEDLRVKKNTQVVVPFAIGDVDNPVNLLVLGATSSNGAVVPNANLAINGSGSVRYLVIRPANNATGTTTITVGVNDGLLTTTRKFTLTVK